MIRTPKGEALRLVVLMAAAFLVSQLAIPKGVMLALTLLPVALVPVFVRAQMRGRIRQDRSPGVGWTIAGAILLWFAITAYQFGRDHVVERQQWDGMLLITFVAGLLLYWRGHRLEGKWRAGLESRAET